MFGNTTGKNALEKGSRSRVGSISETAAPNQSAGGTWALVHRRRTSHAITGNVIANRISVPFQSPGRRMPCPARRKAIVAASQITNPVRISRVFIT
jgi:hypothetical protein